MSVLRRRYDRVWAARRQALTDDAGFSIVEVMVAAIVIVLGAIAVFGMLEASTRNTYRAEQRQVAINRVQSELEKIRSLTYADVAMTVTPAHSSNTRDPRNRVNGGDFDLDPGSGTNYAEMVVRNVTTGDTGTINPGPTSFTDGDVKGKIYRFVVWQNDATCNKIPGSSSVDACPGPRDYKRVIVVVTLDDAPISFARGYEEEQSNFVDPSETAVSNSDPGAGVPYVTAQQFFLTDTTCNNSTRQDITADHNEHQTLGTCDATNPNKPDLLSDSAAPDSDPNDPNLPLLYDYAQDIEPQPGNSDKGLQLLRQSANGCAYSGGANPQYKIHRWVSAPLTQNFVMGGQATLIFYTRTINNLVGSGQICVFLFTRSETVSGGVTNATDTQLIDLNNPPNAFFSYLENPWPNQGWARRNFVMNFSSTTVPASNATTTRRIGLAIAVRRDNTAGDYVEFLYDHPDYPSRLEVKTTTPLP